MENKQIDLKALAERIHDLDHNVYKATGSNLGRVFNTGKDAECDYIIDLMKSKKGATVLRRELALIGNMAKTIPDKIKREELQKEYYSIIALTKQQAINFTRIEILDESRAKLNASTVNERFSDQKRKIVCIGRTMGCGGSEIGFEVAAGLGINYYDSQIFEEILKRLNASNSSIWDDDTKVYETVKANTDVYKGKSFETTDTRILKQLAADFSKYQGLPKRDALFFTESKLISKLAKEEDFVIMGRYASSVLTNEEIPHVNIFITAPMEQRIARFNGKHPELSRKDAEKKLIQSDKQHLKDFKYFTGLTWGAPENYDLVVNSSSYGIPGSVELILDMLEREV